MNGLCEARATAPRILYSITEWRGREDERMLDKILSGEWLIRDGELIPNSGDE